MASEFEGYNLSKFEEEEPLSGTVQECDCPKDPSCSESVKTYM
jgi:hypothetical protein